MTSLSIHPTRLAQAIVFISIFSLSLSGPAQSPAPIVPGGIYALISQRSGLALDNGGQQTANIVYQWATSQGNTNQQWKLVSAESGRYMLQCLTSGLALDSGGTDNDGASTMEAIPSANKLSQQWSLVMVTPGVYRLINASNGKALDNSGSTSNGGSVWQWDDIPGNANQLWQLSPVTIGATTPFTSLEAENGTLLGSASIVALTTPPSNEFSSPELEASEHAFVHLAATNDSVSWTNSTTVPATAINVRYSIPDAPEGGGITSTLDLYVNGQFRQAIPVNSKQTWMYETSANYDGNSENPSDGNPHVFWDEVHQFITGAPVPIGGTITLKKDASNTAAFYNIDVVDVEAPPAPLTQPANSLSITSCGAKANNIAFDSTTAIQTCIDQAQSSGQSIWIPAGIFYLNSYNGLSATGITIEGAGMWYSTIYINASLPATAPVSGIQPTSATLRNFAIDGNATGLAPSGGNSGAINIEGNNWLIDSLWIQHHGAGIWADGTNGVVQNCRLDSLWADGINLNNGNGGTNNGTGNNLIARNNFVRGSGDDGLAINDGIGPGVVPMQDIQLLNNTVVAPWWANNIGVYGSISGRVANNLVMDSVKELGISVSVFGNNDPSSGVEVQGNTILRGGSNGYGDKFPGLGIGAYNQAAARVSNAVVRGNTIVSAMFDGVDVYSCQGAIVANNTVVSPNLDGFIVISSSLGNATFFYNTLEGLNSGQTAFENESATTFTVNGIGNVGFTVP